MSRIDAGLIAFLMTSLLLLVLRPFVTAFGPVDRPGGRKTHVGVVPVIGGICMYLGLAVVLPHHAGVLFLGLTVIGLLQAWAVRRAWKFARWLRRWKGETGREHVGR